MFREAVGIEPIRMTSGVSLATDRFAEHRDTFPMFAFASVVLLPRPVHLLCCYFVTDYLGPHGLPLVVCHSVIGC